MPLRRSAVVILAAAPFVVAACGAGGGRVTATAVARASAGGRDWTRFGVVASRSNARSVGLAAGAVARLRRQQIRLPGTVDSSPIYLRGIRAAGRRRDVLVMTTTYGITLAVDVATARIVWRFTPPGLRRWAGSAQITTASPVADPGRRFLYAASSDGRIHKLSVATGRETRVGSWPARLTVDPTHEKLPSALNVAGRFVLATTGGYIGDAPPYQGHAVAIDRRSGRIGWIFNALCSDRRRVIVPRTCPESGAAMWARSGAVVEPGGKRLLVASGDGKWDGRTHWGDSVLELSVATGRLLRSFTPANHADLEEGDVDLGSTAPAVLSRDFVVQGGKEGVLDLLDLRRLGRGRTGGEVQTIAAPGRSGVFTAPAVWRHGGRVWLFVTTDGGTAAYTFAGSRLRRAWSNATPGTSPVVAAGLLYVYDPGGGLVVYRAATGRRLRRLPAGGGHWNSPIVGRTWLALPQGDANDHARSGILNLYR